MKKEKRRQQILQAATSVFAAKGYHQASVTDIIESAGIARGTFYLYFEGKREIFAELVDILTVQLNNSMVRVDLSGGGKPWLEQIRSNMRRIANVLIENRELTQMLYNHAMGLDEEFDRKIRDFYQGITHKTAGAFKLGQEMGLMRKDLSPLLAAYHTVGSIKEVIYHVARSDLSLAPEKIVDELILYSTEGLLSGNEDKKKTRGKKK